MTDASTLRVVLDGSVLKAPSSRDRGAGLHVRELLRQLRRREDAPEVVVVDPETCEERPAGEDPDLPEVVSPWLRGDQGAGHLLWEGRQSLYWQRRGLRVGEVALFPTHVYLPWGLPWPSVVVVRDPVPAASARSAAWRGLSGLLGVLDALDARKVAGAARVVAASEPSRRDILSTWGLPPDQVVVIPDDSSPPGTHEEGAPEAAARLVALLREVQVQTDGGPP